MIRADQIVAVIGNVGINDFTRGYFNSLPGRLDAPVAKQRCDAFDKPHTICSHPWLI
jgi:hypothetical protein